MCLGSAESMVLHNIVRERVTDVGNKTCMLFVTGGYYMIALRVVLSTPCLAMLCDVTAASPHVPGSMSKSMLFHLVAPVAVVCEGGGKQCK